MTAFILDAPSEVMAPAAEAALVSKHRVRKSLSAGESMFRGVLANLSAQPVTWASSLLAAAVLPRFLGSDGVGQLAIAFAIQGLATPMLDLGFLSYFTRRVSQQPRTAQHDLGVALISHITIYTIGACVLALLAPVIAPGLRDFRILYWALAWMIFSCTQILLAAVLRGQEKHVRYAWICVLPEVISALGAAALLFFGADVLTYAAAGVIFGIVGVAVSWRLAGVRPSWPALDADLLAQIREFLRGGLPFFTWNLTMAFYGQIDRLLLAFFVPAAEVGWYSEAYRIIAIPIFFPSLLVVPLLPVLSRARTAEALRTALAETLRVCLIVTVPLCAGLMVIASLVPGLLGWPEDFSHAVITMQLLLAQIPVVGVDMVLGTAIMALGRERPFVIVGLGACVLNVVCNLVAIPFFEHAAGNGPIGAALVTGATELWMFVGAVILIPKQILDKRLIWLAARVVAATGAAALAAATTLSIAFILAMVVGSGTYLALVCLLRVVSKDDLEYVMQRVRRRWLLA